MTAAAPLRPLADQLVESQTEVRLMADVVRALVIRLGGQVVVTADDLFVGQRCDLAVGPLAGGGLALQVVLPKELPPGPKEFRP